jgi:hypothetical protein
MSVNGSGERGVASVLILPQKKGVHGLDSPKDVGPLDRRR